LGGGLTSAASIVTDTKGYSFNAAGLHPNSIKDFGKKRSDGDNIIDVFYVKGEMLTTAQNPWVNVPARSLVGTAIAGPLAGGALAAAPIYEAVGQSHKLPAVDKDGESQWLWEAGTIDRHGMNYVINGLEKQKIDDIETINTPINTSLDRAGKVTDIPLIDNVGNFFARDNKAREIINSLSDEQLAHLPTSTKNRLIKELEDGWTSDEETSLLKRVYKSYNPDTDGTLLEDALDATDWANRDDRVVDMVESLSESQLYNSPTSTKKKLIESLEQGWTSGTETNMLKRAYKSYNPDTDGTLLEDALDATDWANRDDRALDIVNSLSNEQLAKLPKSTKDRLIKNLEAGWTSAQESSAITRLKRAP